jgi:two-component system chemotaxis sensor kinase CheA
VDLENSRGLLEEFHAETLEHLEAIERASLALERNRDDRESLDDVFRSFHSVKGNAGFLGLRPMQLLAHEVESVLDLVRQRRLAVTSPLIDQVLRARDAMVSMAEQIAEALRTDVPPQAIVPIRSLLQVIRELPRTEAPGESRAPMGSSFLSVDTRSTQRSGPSIRVPLERVTRLRDVVGELVILRNALSGVAVSSDVETLVRQLTRVTTEIEQLTRSLKMVPILPAFQKMERLVRDLAQSFGKQVALSLEGGETELDRSIVEGLSDPLMHMMRNALDHGIETPAERSAGGKSEAGTVELRAYQRENNVVVELKDDGRGIDPQRVWRVAVDRGIVAPAATLSRDEILALIFAPGFSMAEKVTAVSGRGVGMDVLKRNIDRLGGRIELSSVVGQGTTFRIVLPLEVPTLMAHVFRSGDETFAVAADSLLGFSEAPRAAGAESVPAVYFGGQPLPLYRLGADGGVERVPKDDPGGAVMVLAALGRRLGLRIDQLNGRQEVLVSNHTSRLRRQRLAAGVARLSDGTEAVILNVISLVLEAPSGEP